LLLLYVEYVAGLGADRVLYISVGNRRVSVTSSDLIGLNHCRTSVSTGGKNDEDDDVSSGTVLPVVVVLVTKCLYLSSVPAPFSALSKSMTSFSAAGGSGLTSR
jgi:hypothetical protein